MTETPSTTPPDITDPPECRANYGVHITDATSRMGFDTVSEQYAVEAVDPTLPPEGFGRGAWTPYGMPNGSIRNYRMVDPPVVGGQAEKSTSHRAVNAGALALQFFIDQMGYTTKGGARLTLDGTLGVGTARAITWAQREVGLKGDGIAGYATCRLLVARYSLAIEAENKIPDRLVFGLCGQESGWDPGAIGYTTPSDHGLVQINLVAHSDITYENAMHPEFSLTYAAARMRYNYTKFRNGGASERLAWDCAIAQHNSPMLAKEWALTGVAPVVATRADGNQIGDYVAKVRAFAAAAPAVV